MDSNPDLRMPTLVPIRSLGTEHRARIATHLLALSEQDRYLRFGYPATDEHIRRYVEGLNFERDQVFGIFNRRLDLLAVAHLARYDAAEYQGCAEFGVSVAAHARGRGYGSLLFERSAMHARNDGVHMLFVHALSQNATMLHIAQKAGATLKRDGAESEAYLTLRDATLDSRLAEIVQEQFAQVDYRLKVQQQQHLQSWVSCLQPWTNLAAASLRAAAGRH